MIFDQIPKLTSTTASYAYLLADIALEVSIHVDKWIKDTDVKADQSKLEMYITDFETFFKDESNLELYAEYIKKNHSLDHIKFEEIKPCLVVQVKHWRRVVHVMVKDPYMQRNFPEIDAFKKNALELHALLLAEIDTLRQWR